MLFAYLDDSADAQREKHFACGGLVGGENQWETFDLRWIDATYELERPFRSTDCECGHGQFSDESKWPKHKRDQLMERLVALIADYLLSGFASIVPIREYRQVFPCSKEYDPYYLAVRHTIINMAYVGYATSQRIKLWCEDSGATAGTTLKIYQDIRATDWKPAEKLGGISFAGKYLCPLQGADLLAREAFKHIDNFGVRPTRKPAKALQGRSNFILWTRQALEYLRDNGGPDDYALLTDWSKNSPVPTMTVFWKDFEKPLPLHVLGG